MRGTTEVLPYGSEVEAVHLCLLPNGKVLYYSGFRKAWGEPTETRVWNPATGEIKTVPTPADLFCAGHAMLPDGRVLSSGGTLEYRNLPSRLVAWIAQLLEPIAPLPLQVWFNDRSKMEFTGTTVLYAFDWREERWDFAGEMRHGRWYPTLCPLPDGGVLILSGQDEAGGVGRHEDPEWAERMRRMGMEPQAAMVNQDVEVFRADGRIELKGPVAGPGIRPRERVVYGAGHAHAFPTLYPRLHLMPDSSEEHPLGRVFCSGYGPETKMLDLATWEWSHVDDLRYEHPRHDGNCVLLPLDPEDGYRARVLTFGGSRETALRAVAIRSAEMIDLSGDEPRWELVSDAEGPLPSPPRVNGCALLLPDGNVLAVGGNSTGRWDDPRLEVEVWNTRDGGWERDHAPIRVKRGYHCTALLLPDARVLVSGTTPASGKELRMELYAPYYLDGVGPSDRPCILRVGEEGAGVGFDAPQVAYGEELRVRCRSARPLARAALLRPGAFTHAFDMNQRHVWLRIAGEGDGVVTLAAPPDELVAPPGHWMLFLLDEDGVPSVGRFVHLPVRREAAPPVERDFECAAPAPAPETLADTLARSAIRPEEHRALLEDLQGNILKSHGRNRSVHLFLRFGDAEGARAWLRRFARERVTSAWKQYLERERPEESDPFASVSLTHAGYRALGFAEERIPGAPSGMPPVVNRFRLGMKHEETRRWLHDPPVEEWEEPYRGEIHALVVLADDDQKRLAALAEEVDAEVEEFGEVLTREHGLVRRWQDDPRGRPVEHFGYVDGVSQPLFYDYDLNRQAQDESGWWDASAPLSLVLVPDPGGREGVSCGSYVVYRKLRQDVDGFRAAVGDLARRLGVDEEQAYAQVVGRFRDGTPLVSSDRPRREDPRASSPNRWNFDRDSRGRRCPFHAHVRKANPRGEKRMDGRERCMRFFARFGFLRRMFRLDEKLNRRDRMERSRRIARRAIPYGGDEGGRGLLFLCAQADIARQFEFIQAVWCNRNTFVRDGTGLDPIVGRDRQQHGGQWWPGRSGRVQFDLRDYVHLRGGAYLFTPSLTTLQQSQAPRRRS